MSLQGRILDAFTVRAALRKKDLGPFIYAVNRMSSAINRINRKSVVMLILWLWPIDL